MALTPGAHIGSYEIIELVGAGGMGEVYRARDQKLKRDVALKVLPDAFAHDADRLTRFQREAELLATLNHQGIAAVYGLAEAGECTGIVLEFVEGETLADRIARGALPVDDAIAVAGQIVDALEAAHDKGIVHRDLKPANVKLSPSGAVKVLDFGLAKMVETSAAPSASPATPSLSPTLSARATMAGVVLGTAAYMSPEQARGKPVDRRTDIWAFGCVLFEMLTGVPAFEAGDTVTDIIAAIIKNEPDWGRMPAGTPPRVVALLRRCLQKDPRRRLPHIGVARLELDDAANEPDPAVPTPQVGGRVRSSVPWAIAAAAISALTVLGALVVRHREPASFGAIRFALTAADDVTFGSNISQRGTAAPAPHFAPSPDGRSIAFVAYKGDERPQLWIRRLDTQSIRAVAGTEEASFPFWSPDSRAIAFFTQRQLKRVDTAGGPVVVICDAPAGEGGTWNRDGVIVFARDDTGALFRVSAAGGVATAVTTLDAERGEVSHRWPQFLPDGRHFLYLALTGTPTSTSTLIAPEALERLRVVYVGSLDSPDRTVVLGGALRAMYGGGHILFLRGTTLMAQPFDPVARRLSGEPVPIAENIANNTGNGRTAFSVSEAGVLTYRTGITTMSRGVLSWLDRTGKRTSSVGGPADYVEAQLSPDATAVAALIANRPPGTVVSPGPQSSDLWVLDLSRNGIATRLTFRADEPKAGIAWSPDASRIAFGLGSSVLPRLQGGGIYASATNGGGGDAQQLFRGEGGQRPTSWSRDGRVIAFNQINTRNLHRDVWLLPLSGDRKPTPLLQSTYIHEQAAFSPDGRWVAYASDKGGEVDVYVRATVQGDREWRISQNGGNQPAWRADGRELFYWNPTLRTLMAVAIRPSATFEPATPAKLFNIPRLRTGGLGQYSVAPDGQRFLIIEPEGTPDAQIPIDVVVNWTAVLNDR
jgi:eukaryotic-like serine/threonine-protein kinase